MCFQPVHSHNMMTVTVMTAALHYMTHKHMHMHTHMQQNTKRMAKIATPPATVTSRPTTSNKPASARALHSPVHKRSKATVNNTQQ